MPEENVAVGTTHNHSVPVTLELGGAWIRRNRELVAPYVEIGVRGDRAGGRTRRGRAAARPGRRCHRGARRSR